MCVYNIKHILRINIYIHILYVYRPLYICVSILYKTCTCYYITHTGIHYNTYNTYTVIHITHIHIYGLLKKHAIRFKKKTQRWKTEGEQLPTKRKGGNSGRWFGVGWKRRRSGTWPESPSPQQTRSPSSRIAHLKAGKEPRYILYFVYIICTYTCM